MQRDSVTWSTTRKLFILFCSLDIWRCLQWLLLLELWMSTVSKRRLRHWSALCCCCCCCCWAVANDCRPLLDIAMTRMHWFWSVFNTGQHCNCPENENLHWNAIYGSCKTLLKVGLLASSVNDFIKIKVLFESIVLSVNFFICTVWSIPNLTSEFQ